MADLIYPDGAGITVVTDTELESDDMEFPGTETTANGGGPLQAKYSEIKTGICGNPVNLGNVTSCTNIYSLIMSMTASGSQGGKMEIKSYYAQSSALDVSAVLTLNVPQYAVILGCLLRVDTAVTDDGGDDTWSAAYSGGATQSIVTGAAAAQNTKVNQFFDPNAATPIASAATNITFTPNGGNFTAGVICGCVFALVLTDMDNV